MLCSVLIPTRKRPERLRRSIESVIAAADERDFEFVLRVDTDDKETLEYIPSLVFPGVDVRTVIGLRGHGYSQLNLLYTDADQTARGDWSLIWNDDVTMEGKGWDTKLKPIPRSGFIVHQQFYQFNLSRYSYQDGGPFPWIPSRVYERFGSDRILEPVDYQLDKLLRLDNGWKTIMLDDIACNHQRDPQEEIDQHRLINGKNPYKLTEDGKTVITTQGQPEAELPPSAIQLQNPASVCQTESDAELPPDRSS